jgi:NADPH:quinone reductase-like Zn-dependent oxidoreductase
MPGCDILGIRRMQSRRFFLRRHATGFDLGKEMVAVPTPGAGLGAGEVLVRMRAVSLNRRDAMIRDLSYGTAPGADLFTPLSDGAGEIVAVGEGAGEGARAKVGDRVAATFFQAWPDGPISLPALMSSLGAGGTGTLADHVVLKDTGIVPLPDDWSFEQGATIGCAAVTAWSALVRLGRIAAGDKVLILGTGGVALFAMQIAVAHGAEVAIVSSSDAKLAGAKALGATYLVNRREHPEWGARVRELTGGVQQALELGGANTLPQTMASMALGGHIALIGALAGGGGDVPLRGFIMGSLRTSAVIVGSRADHLAVQTMLAAWGQLPVIDSIFPADEAEAAYQQLEAGAFGKVVISL